VQLQRILNYRQITRKILPFSRSYKFSFHRRNVMLPSVRNIAPNVKDFVRGLTMGG
jgi:hypothetical protein